MKRIHFTGCRLRKPFPSIKSCASALPPILNLCPPPESRPIPSSPKYSPSTSGDLIPMKRSIEGEDSRMKKIRIESGRDEVEEGGGGVGAMQNLDENLLFEVLKHVDDRTLAAAACVSKLWHRTAQDERLWELICTRQWANIGCGNQQLRSVVLALGGFRLLHSQCLVPLSKPQSASASPSAAASASASASATVASAWPTAPSSFGSKPPAKWGKDEVHLFLSLLSIRYYEKMNFCSRGK